MFIREKEIHKKWVTHIMPIYSKWLLTKGYELSGEDKEGNLIINPVREIK